MPIKIKVPENGKAVTIKVKCGQCVFYQREAHAAFETPCINRGIKTWGLPCGAFQTSPSFVNLSIEQNRKLRELMRSIKDPETFQLTMALLNQAANAKRKGFAVGDKAYYRVVPRDYVSNYFEVEVFGWGHGFLRIKGKNGFLATPRDENVLTREQFIEKRKELKRAGKLWDPEFRSYFRVKPSGVNLDSVLPTKADSLKFNANIDVNALVWNREKGTKRSIKKPRAAKVMGGGSVQVRRRVSAEA